MNRMDIPSFDKVMKHDLATGKVWTHDLGEGRACGDIVFVPDPESTSEDDGHRLVMVHVLNEERTELVALGRDEKTGGFQVTATVKVPVRVPFGFHNEFVPGSELVGVW